MFKKIVSGLLLLGAVGVLRASEPPGVTLELYPDQELAAIRPDMYGIFFEDINFGADGGLYGELIKNRSFDFPHPLVPPRQTKSPSLISRETSSRAVTLPFLSGNSLVTFCMLSLSGVVGLSSSCKDNLLLLILCRRKAWFCLFFSSYSAD